MLVYIFLEKKCTTAGGIFPLASSPASADLLQLCHLPIKQFMPDGLDDDMVAVDAAARLAISPDLLEK